VETGDSNGKDEREKKTGGKGKGGSLLYASYQRQRLCFKRALKSEETHLLISERLVADDGSGHL